MRALIVVAMLALVGCEARATETDCTAILNRIVDLELLEQGFRDPVLAAQKREEMRQALAGRMRGCVGKAIRPDALACVREARSSEEISHRCLR